MRLIIHAGHPKCGSTTIQSLLWNNRFWLEQRGICLLGNEFLLPSETADWNWPLWFLNNPADAGKVAARLVARLPNFKKAGANTLILSAENLSDPTRLAQLEPAFGSFDTFALYYMRRQDHFLVSSWRQWGMKRGINLQQHILRRVVEARPDYLGTLKYLERTFSSRVHARFLDPRYLARQDLADDLWEYLKLREHPPLSANAFNPSPDRAILLFLSQHPDLFESEHDDGAAQEMLLADLGAPRKLLVDRHTQKSLKLAYDGFNDEIVCRFMGREDGRDVIPLDAPVEQDSALTEDDLSRLRGLIPRISSQKLREALQVL